MLSYARSLSSDDAGYVIRDASAEHPGSIATMSGYAAVFNRWTEIDNPWEGHFREQLAPGAFRKTLNERARAVPIMFNHGQDVIGQQVLGIPSTLEERGRGLWYEVPLFDTQYNRDLLPGLKAGAYGASFRFRPVPDKDTVDNGGKIRSVTRNEVVLRELGPVSFPQYEDATATARSLDLHSLLASRQLSDSEKLVAEELIDALEALLGLVEDETGDTGTVTAAGQATAGGRAAHRLLGAGNATPLGPNPQERRAFAAALITGGTT